MVIESYKLVARLSSLLICVSSAMSMYHFQRRAGLFDLNGAQYSFTYLHADRWYVEYPDCGGGTQSPVHIVSDEMERVSAEPHLTFHAYKHQPHYMYIINNGHTLQITGTWRDIKPFISGGLLTGNYTFEQLHFHWSHDDLYGSEHIINNRSFPMEMHAVHYKKEYGNIQHAVQHEDGLVVIAYLFAITAADVTYGIHKLKPYIAHLKRPVNEYRPMKPFALSLFDLEFHEDYVMYRGSLTTPPCTESVIWIIYSMPLYITYKEFNSVFRRLRLSHHDRHNVRPVQPRNGRPMYYVVN